MSEPGCTHETWDDGFLSGSDPAVSAARELLRAPHPVLPDADVERIAAQLTLAVTSQTPARWIPWRHVQRWAVAAVLVLISMALLMTWMAADSLPGEVLYSVKRGAESVRLVVANDAAAVDLHLAYAERRLDEFETLLADETLDLGALDAATGELDAALGMMESGQDAARAFDLSVRAVRLAESAGARRADDGAVLDALARRIQHATALGVQSQQLNGFVAAPVIHAADTGLYLPE